MSERHLSYWASSIAWLVAAATACSDSTPPPPTILTTEAAQLVGDCVDLSPRADTWLSSTSITSNHGAEQVLRVSNTAEGLVWFSLSSLPYGVEITSATLTLHVSQGSSATIQLHRVTQAWGESTVAYSNFNQAFEDEVIGTVTTDASDVQRSIDLTSAVQSWFAGTKVNHGVLLETSSPEETVFVSRDGDGDAQRPVLQVCYVAAPSTGCSPNPCQNGGSCTDGVAGYTCSCPAGYDGASCETNIDDCSPNPCQNGGSCVDGVDSYTCQCTIDWVGPLCQTNACDDGNPCTLDDNTPTGCVYSPNLADPACHAAITSVASGAYHTCTIRQGGQVYCWGMRDEGRLGNGPWTAGYQLTPVQVTGITDAVGTDAGFDHACAVRANGEVACWGGNALGQLGNGSTLSSSVPVEVAGISDALEVATARNYTCVLRANGEIRCFGRGIEGELGHGSSSNSLVPVKVIDDVDLVGPSATPTPHAAIPWVGVAATELFTCGLRANGQVLCWGSNGNGQLGYGGTTGRNQPALVSGISDAVAIAAGRTHACAVRATGNVACWGSSFALGRSGSDLTEPATIGNATNPFANAVTISASGFHTCATTTFGSTWCWGQGQQGQLAEVGSSAVPVAIRGPGVDTSSVATSSGFCHACARLEDGDLRCWGSTSTFETCRSQLGWGVTDGSTTPVSPLLPGP